MLCREDTKKSVFFSAIVAKMLDWCFKSTPTVPINWRGSGFCVGMTLNLAGTLKCMVCISSDYPHTPPAFIIKIEDAEEGEVQEVQIKVMALWFSVRVIFVDLTEYRGRCEHTFSEVIERQ